MKKPNLFFMYGDDSLSLLQEVERWKSTFIEKQTEVNLEMLQGETVSLSDLSSSLLSTPFLADKRLIILKNFLGHLESSDQKKVEALLDKIPDCNLLLWVETGSVDKRGALLKTLMKIAHPKLFAAPKGAQLLQWVNRRAELHGGQMADRASSYLIQIVGENLYKLENEIQKLCLFAEGKTITIETIDDLVSGRIEQSIFALTDHIAQKNRKAALSTLKELETQGHEAPYLFAMIARQFRLLLEVKALAEEGMPPGSMASKMASHPFVVSTALRQSRNFNMKQLKEALLKLLELDKRFKTGQLHSRTNDHEHYLLLLEKILIAN